MSLNSKNKGKRGELEFSALCRAKGYDTHRTQQFCGNTGEAADVIGLPGIHVEVKRNERLNIYNAMAQAMNDSNAEGEGNIPIVAFRKNRKPWLITMNSEDFFKLYKAWVVNSEVF